MVAVGWAWLAGLALKQLVYQEVRRHHREGKWAGAGAMPLAWGAALLGVTAALVVGVILRRPVLGPLCLVVTPAFVRWALAANRARRRRLLEAEMVTFFHGLRGLTRAGLALPSALFHLSRTLPGDLPPIVHRYLKSYEKGRPLARCLEDFRAQVELSSSSVAIALLGLAYRQGLSVAPILEQALPALEADLQARQRADQIRKAALAQGVLAAAIPWGLVFVLKLFQPDVVDSFFSSRLAPFVVGGALIWEGVGISAIRRAAC